jgi:hypothetical protein
VSAEPMGNISGASATGQKYERIAFTFCRAGTIVLFTQLLVGERWVLPLVALTTAVLYGVAYVYGKRDTRCVLRLPWVIIVFWGVVAAVAIVLIVRGLPWPAVVH